MSIVTVVLCIWSIVSDWEIFICGLVTNSFGCLHVYMLKTSEVYEVLLA